ncbi:MAG: PIN domain-containing protein [Lautropia sp.]|nr:PIN domain-containing protein [Lautropia sp.]
MRALLDVNTLIALLDVEHIHHARAAAWMEREVDNGGWASCPITQNGCIRILSQPSYPGGPLPPAETAARLAEACADPLHAFWPDDLSLTDPGTLNWQHILGHRQLTDAYLLALAVRHGGRFVTFDRRLTPEAVPGAGPRHLVVLD